MSSEAFSAGSHLFTTLAASLGLDFEQLQELQNTDGFDALFVDGQSGGSFMQVAYSTEQNIKELTKLRVDAVANAVGDQTVFDDAYEGSHPDIPVEEDKSKIMQAARAIADEGGFSPAKREAFLQYIQDNRGNMKSATIENGKVILMADGARGGYNANLFRTNLDETERDVVTGTFTYTEGGVKKTETVYIFNDCANPAVDAAPDVVEPPKVVPPPATEPPAEVCGTPLPVEKWPITIEDSKDGVRFEDGTYTKVRVFHAPKGMSEADALAALRQYAESSDNKVLKGSWLLYTDSNCDGHPEKIECVTFKVDSEGQVTMKNNTFYGNPGGVGPGRGEMDYDRMSETRQKKVLAN